MSLVLIVEFLMVFGDGQPWQDALVGGSKEWACN